MNSEVNSTQKPVAYVVTPFRIVPDGSYENGPDELVFAEDASDYVEKTGIPLYARPVAAAPSVPVETLSALAERWATDRSYNGSPVDDIRSLIDEFNRIEFSSINYRDYSTVK